MSALTPKACPPSSWHTWLKDGARLVGRIGSGWGVLFWAIFVLRGWLAIQLPLFWGIWLFVMLSPLSELAHLAVFRQAMDGRVGLGGLCAAVRDAWAQNRRVLGQMIRVRALVGIPGVFLLTGPVWLHPGSDALGNVLQALQVSLNMSFWPLIFRTGGLWGGVLLLCARYGVSPRAARELWGQAWDRNRPGFFRLVVVFTLLFCLGDLGPLLWLYPVYELLLHATLTCACADIFEDGYKLKSLVPSPAKGSPRTTLRPAIQAAP